MSITLDLYAAGTDELLASMPVQAAQVNRAKRLLGGLAVPFDVPGNPSIGRAIFRAGSVSVPDDPSWVKLLVEHDPTRSVGYLNEHRTLAAGLLTAFKVADGPAGDEALDAVESRTRDGLSVRAEVEDWAVLQDGTIEIRASRLREVSQVAVPAYESARVNLAASLTDQEGASVMAELANMLDLKASAPTPAPTPNPAPEPQPQPQPDPAPSGPHAPQLLAGAPNGNLDLGALAAALAPHLAAAMAAPESPAGPPIPPRTVTGPGTVRAAAVAVADWQRRDGQNVMALVAALNDVVPADDAGQAFIGRETWLGQLWTAAVTGRPYIDGLGTTKPLTGLKAKGWRWVTKPAVADYAGNKAAIPSNAVSTEPAETNAHRVAGGWDVDRAYVDLGDADMVQALFEAATEDYRAKSNTWTGAQLRAAAAGTIVGAPTDVVGLLVALGASAAGIGARISGLAIAADLFSPFAALTVNEVPWWFGQASATLDPQTQSARVPGFSFFVDPALTSGQWTAWDDRAATYFEVGAPSGTPIKVQAVNIPNGGVDLGVFGYNALLVNDDRAIWAGDTTP